MVVDVEVGGVFKSPLNRVYLRFLVIFTVFGVQWLVAGAVFLFLIPLRSRVPAVFQIWSEYSAINLPVRPTNAFLALKDVGAEDGRAPLGTLVGNRGSSR